MPGVSVKTAASTGPVTPAVPVVGQWFVVGQAERGSTDSAQLLKGMADFELLYGGRVTYGNLYDAVKSYFDQAEDGAQCWVARVVGTAATSGTLTVNDGASPTPVPTLKFDAASPGAWSGNISIAIVDGLIANTFRVQVLDTGVVVEDYNNLDSPATAAAKMSTSNYVKVTDLASPTVAPDNNPANIAATTLSAGNDQRSSVVDATYAAALDLFTKDLGPGAVSVPGVGSGVHSALIDHAQSNNRIAILGAQRGAAKADLISLAGAQNSTYGVLVAPWIVVGDGAGGTRAISPEGYVAACRYTACTQEGPEAVPAGQRAQAVAVLDLDQTFTSDDNDDLDSAHVSMIRKIYGSVRLYGWRSLSSQDGYEYVSIQDLLNSITDLAGRTLEQFVFAPVDGKGQLVSKINAALVGLLDPISQRGGLYALYDTDGNEVDPGYLVDTGSNVNTLLTLQTNTVKAVLSVRPSPNAAFIEITIERVNLTTAL